MAKKTREQLEKDIKALKDTGLDYSVEEAELKAMVLTEADKGETLAPKPTPPAAEELNFIPLNVESFRTGGGGWVTPATTGIKDAVCEGYMIPDFVDDQLWFIFINPAYPGGNDPFRGALVCAAITRGEKSGAWKVKEVLAALEIPYQEDEERGGIKLLASPKGKTCQVLWADIPLKGKTERRIQDVMMPGSEAAM